MNKAPNLPPKRRGAPLGNKNARRAVKLEMLSTTVSQETFDYFELMRDEMSVGKLMDEAIRLYRDMEERNNKEA